jgi:hypothetical protein
VKSFSLAVILCLLSACALVAQTTPPAGPEPQQGEHHRSIFSRLSPPLSLANDTRPMSPGGKFKLFALNTVNPFQFVATAGWAGIEQAENTYPSWGQGGEGFGKRFGALYASTASSNFFGTFLFPSILRQDPRYFRKETGGFGTRLGYSLSRVFVTRSDHGHSVPNLSLWLGAGSSAALGNLYYPTDQQGAGDVLGRAGINIATTAGFNIAREFWPDIGHRLFGHK